MINRVAQKLSEANYEGRVWTELTENQRDFWRTQARAAIEAMQDPTNEMIAAGRDANDKYASEVAPCSSFRANDCWRAMISTALLP